MATEPLTQIGDRAVAAGGSVGLPALTLLDKCVHCGFCLPACPTYTLWGNEMDSPRGRIWMMRKAATGEAAVDDTFQTHMDNCLGCMACMTACPSGVEYNKLIEETRVVVERETKRPLEERLYRGMLFATFPHPLRLKLLGVPISLYQRSGVQWLVRRVGLLRWLPRRLQAMEALLPKVPVHPFSTMPELVRHAEGTMFRGRVGMLTGCVQDAYFGHVNRATARVLAAEGYDVVIPRAQGCCGALMVHSGLDEDAKHYARRLIEQFEAAGVETVVINAAGCGSTMKEYAYLLREDVLFAERARVFSSRCKDISEVLADRPAQAARSALTIKVAYHDACHLRHAQGVAAQPRALLGSIPELRLLELPEADLCCGSAGIYNLLHPETADELGDRKVQHLVASGAEALISANPGCLLQLQASLRRNGHNELPTLHLVELLDASIRGVAIEQILAEQA